MPRQLGATARAYHRATRVWSNSVTEAAKALSHTGGARILVTESNPVILMDIAEILQDAGYDVVKAGNGTDALRLLDEPDKVDLVITSLNIAGADGLELAWRAKTNGEPVPVVFISGRVDLPFAEAHPPARSWRLSKPFSITDLHKAIDDLLDDPKS